MTRAPRMLYATLLAVALTGVARHADASRLLVHAGHLVDVERGTVVAAQAIWMADGRIVRVEPWGAVPAGTQVLDWSRYTVLPGLIDLHTHIADAGQSADPAAPLKSTPARDAFIGAKNARDTLF